MRVRCDQREGSIWRVAFEPNDEGDVSLTGKGLEELLEVFAAADERASGCRVVVLESKAPDVFCRGMDLRFLTSHAGEDQTERIEALVTPHISDYQWRGVRFEAIRNFIRNRRLDIEREIYGADMPLWPR